MRILHIATSLNGGAGSAALRVNRALNMLGEESTIVCREEVPIASPPDFESIKVSAPKKLESSAVTWFQSRIVQKNEDLVTPWSINTFNFQNESLKKADVIHVHAYYNFLSHTSLRNIVSLGRPTFFTLHDQRLITGGCHYSRACKKFESECSNCPQVNETFVKLVKKSFSMQKNIFESSNNVELISPSRWLADLARHGALSRNLPVHVVRNPIPRVFFETPITLQKKSNNALRIAFIATNLHNPYKDFAVFIKAINAFSRQSSKQVCVVLAGYGEIPNFESTVQIENVHPNGDSAMADLLSTVDLVIVPSNQDNSPSVIGEALAMGVPVIGSDAGGIPEILEDFQMGIFSVGDEWQLTGLIEKFVIPESNVNIRKKAKAYFSEENIAHQLLDIYKESDPKMSKLV